MADLDFKVIGLKIKQRRQELGITQEYIANALDVNPSHISNIECGRANPSLTALIKIANILSCSVDYFISDEYTFEINKNREKTLDDKIIDKIKYCDTDKKTRILKICCGSVQAPRLNYPPMDSPLKVARKITSRSITS